jgi:hypothetical protein
MRSKRARRPSRWGTRGSWLARGLVLALAVSSALAIRSVFVQLPLRAEAGYGDSYVMYDVQHFARTGQIYRDSRTPPYLPTQYSPLVYTVLSVPERLAADHASLIATRALVLAAFLGCVGLAVSITSRLVPVPAAGWWALAVAASIATFWNWAIQIRADFLGVFCSLLVVRALLSHRRGAVILAGIAAGLAVQFKLTFVAAGLAGMIWLAAGREWRRLLVFTSLAAAASVGVYAAWAAREPRMLSQILALSPGVAEHAGAMQLMHIVLSQPAPVLALVGAATLLPRMPRAWGLLVTLCVLAFGVGALTSMQAGANQNYYFEYLFASIPLAVRGILRFDRLPARRALVAVALLVLAMTVGFRYRVTEVRAAWNRPSNARTLDVRVQVLSPILATRRSLATVPWVAVLDPHPSLVEPYLLSYLIRLGRTSPTPLPAEVRAKAFDAVFTAPTAQEYRGVPHINGILRAAIASAYVPYCVMGPVLAHLPAGSPPESTSLATDLRAAGCRPLTPDTTPVW